eukprot:CAMPEP_0201549950 /NCGR_PEP_ID=MMETSP0173_2-20130828/6370_1 /ASSEMBLY_ACC=CAM_ASM_000268 /TAXON_ID=218659 /ORGANISM="Vexillifera sp., Strain DIVA3 564/2" /LENGTH=190 /DNA_ID=CAMNT_0047959797 /DNA_START=47 /DNA_END=619 /DNA_ORIENTATION=+
MGIDIGKKHVKKRVRTTPRSQDPYLVLLVKLYAFLARRTDSKFNATVHKRLCKSRVNRPPMSIARIARHMKGEDKDRIAVVVGTVTNDIRLHKLFPMKICALKFTEPARARILKAGGECLTFDQLALQRPTGSNTFLMRGPKSRTARRHFSGLHGAPGVVGGTARPYCKHKGRNHEMARGRRASRGYKNN